MTKPHEIWLQKAEEDFRFAELGYRSRFFSHVCFLAQQVVEKCLKAMILKNGCVYPKTHKLVDLYAEAIQFTPNLSEKLQDLKILDQYYIPTRYPDGIPGSLPEREPMAEEAKEALDIAKSVLALCKAA